MTARSRARAGHCVPGLLGAGVRRLRFLDRQAADSPAPCPPQSLQFTTRSDRAHLVGDARLGGRERRPGERVADRHPRNSRRAPYIDGNTEGRLGRADGETLRRPVPAAGPMSHMGPLPLEAERRRSPKVGARPARAVFPRQNRFTPIHTVFLQRQRRMRRCGAAQKRRPSDEPRRPLARHACRRDPVPAAAGVAACKTVLGLGGKRAPPLPGARSFVGAVVYRRRAKPWRTPQTTMRGPIAPSGATGWQVRRER
jgi:hypothetical protein